MLKNLLGVLPLTAVAAIAVVGAVDAPASADGTSSKLYGCYSSWWDDATAQWCEPATRSGSYQNQYRCASGFWYASNYTHVNANQFKTQFNYRDDCWFSVLEAHPTY